MKKNYPTIEQCLALYQEYETPEHVIRHCLAVTDAALKIAGALNKNGFQLNLELIERAGMLHDLARAGKNHAEVAADILERLGYEDIPRLVRCHMAHNFPEQLSEIEELDLLCLGDRLILEDTCVGLEKRMENVLYRFREEPEVLRDLKKRVAAAKNLIRQIEDRIGRSLSGLLQIPGPSLRTLLHQVEKPGRYIGGELNAVHKSLADVDTRFGFAFPDLYEIGMSYLGLQIIYHLLNMQPHVYCERIFAPADDMEKLMVRHGIPLLTIETRTPVRDLDIAGFTLQYELSYTNVLHMLRLAGIPLRSAARKEGDPFVVAGGPCAFNPEPLAEAIDLFMIGDGEEVLPALCRVHQQWKRSGAERREFLKKASRLQGVYVPAFYEEIRDAAGCFFGLKKLWDGAPDVIEKNLVRNLDETFIPERPVVPLIETVHDRAVVEIFRGCTRGCRFCQAGMIYRPVRERTQASILNNIARQLDHTGYDEVSILSLSTSDYSGIEVLVSQLMDHCKRENAGLSLPSLRLDSFSFNVLQEIQQYRKTGLTFAPEAGTQRLRNVINKSITDEDIYRAVEQAVSLGWHHMKFYFMIGLPTETMEDLDGIVEIARRSMEIARGVQKKGRRTFSLTVSASNFVPKPHTPFQWAAQDDEAEFLRKNLYLKEKLKPLKGVNFQFHDTRTSHLEALLARGDRRTFSVLADAEEMGCRFDSWREYFDYDHWKKAFEKNGLPMTGGAPDPEKPLPWDHISCGIRKSFLTEEWNRAMGRQQTEDCRIGCMDCGLDCRRPAENPAGEANR